MKLATIAILLSLSACSNLADKSVAYQAEHRRVFWQSLNGGGLYGLLQGASMPTAEGESAAGNMAIGAAAGSAIPAVIRAAKTARAVAVDPFTEAGRGRMAGNAFQGASVFIDTGKSYSVNGLGVVSDRKTGYAAMTGTANKATVYDTATVSLAQLAGRVMQLQADLTTHGLIGA